MSVYLLHFSPVNICTEDFCNNFCLSQFYFVTQTLWYSLLYGLVQSQAISSKKAILQTIKVIINCDLKTNTFPPFSFLKLVLNCSIGTVIVMVSSSTPILKVGNESWSLSEWLAMLVKLAI